MEGGGVIQKQYSVGLERLYMGWQWGASLFCCCVWAADRDQSAVLGQIYGVHGGSGDLFHVGGVGAAETLDSGGCRRLKHKAKVLLRTQSNFIPVLLERSRRLMETQRADRSALQMEPSGGGSRRD